jgi:hypothetical protein
LFAGLERALDVPSAAAPLQRKNLLFMTITGPRTAGTMHAQFQRLHEPGHWK